MQCSVMSSDHNSGIIKMKNYINHKNPSKKEPNPDITVSQQRTRLQDAKDRESASRAGMPTRSTEQAEAVRRYYAAFPALKRGQESPQQYYLPPPAWCRRPDEQRGMQGGLAPKEPGARGRRLCAGHKERRPQHPRRARKRAGGSGGGGGLPEWVTHEGVWDMEAHDPVREFIRALALDEGYGTGEAVPDWDHAPGLRAWLGHEPPAPPSPMEEELYAKFEAKFDRSIEALWATGDGSPDDCRELPVDLHELLASPAAPRPPAPWAAAPGPPPRARAPPPPPEPFASFAPFAPLAMETYSPFPPPSPEREPVARSYAALNHRRERSGFAEVPPRSTRCAPPPPPPPRAASPPADDPLTAARTHFRPIRRAPAPAPAPASPPRLEDGATFDIRGDLEPVEFSRSASGSLYAAGEREPYLEYRPPAAIDYGRLRLTAAQRCAELEDAGLRLRFRLRQRDAATQTEPAADAEAGAGAGAAAGAAAAWARKRRARGACSACCPRPHARFLRCPPSDRPLTR